MYCQLVSEKIKKEIIQNIVSVISKYNHYYVVDTYTNLFNDNKPYTAPLCVNDSIVTDYVKGVLDSFEMEKTEVNIDRYSKHFQDIAYAIEGQIVGDVIANIDKKTCSWLKPTKDVDET
jgi:hypothetical protein